MRVVRYGGGAIAVGAAIRCLLYGSCKRFRTKKDFLARLRFVNGGNKKPPEHRYCKNSVFGQFPFLVEQARVELASYRIAERLSTRLCRNYLRGALSTAENGARQEPENRRCVGSDPPRLYPACLTPASPRREKECGRTV